MEQDTGQEPRKYPNRTAHKKKAFIEALRKSLGIVKAACDVIGIGRTTYYDWLKADKKFETQCLAIQEETLDFAETKLFELIQGIRVIQNVPDESDPERKMIKQVTYKRPPDTAATIFYLKTKGKARGYIEKVELDTTIRDISITEERTYIQKGDA